MASCTLPQAFEILHSSFFLRHMTGTAEAINCVGAWSDCSAACGTGVRTYAVITPPANGGDACEAADGAEGECNTQAYPGVPPASASSVHRTAVIIHLIVWPCRLGKIHNSGEKFLGFDIHNHTHTQTGSIAAEYILVRLP